MLANILARMFLSCQFGELLANLFEFFIYSNVNFGEHFGKYFLFVKKSAGKDFENVHFLKI